MPSTKLSSINEHAEDLFTQRAEALREKYPKLKKLNKDQFNYFCMLPIAIDQYDDFLATKSKYDNENKKNADDTLIADKENVDPLQHLK